jgi:AcrR family transcriptional regulator
MKESTSTKELIRDTLQELLEEKDYTEISMKEIAKSANVGRRTLYRYFGTKADIVRFMADSVMDEFAEALLLQVALKTKLKDSGMQRGQIISEIPKERLYDFYFKIAGYWELTKRWMREENRSTPEEISSLVVKILTQR